MLRGGGSCVVNDIIAYGDSTNTSSTINSFNGSNAICVWQIALLPLKELILYISHISCISLFFFINICSAVFFVVCV